MFYELLLCCIAREVNTRHPEYILGAISSLDALPHDLKKQLEHISILAYEGVMNNTIIFTQRELPSIFHSTLPAAATPTPTQQELPAMGVLQRVQWAGYKTVRMAAYNWYVTSLNSMAGSLLYG